jgi:hypothetical protein
MRTTMARRHMERLARLLNHAIDEAHKSGAHLVPAVDGLLKVKQLVAVQIAEWPEQE